MGPVIAVGEIGDDRVADYRNLDRSPIWPAGGAGAGAAGSFIVRGDFAIRELLRSAGTPCGRCC